MTIMNKASDFKSLLEDKQAPIAADFSSHVPTLLVAFGGHKGGLGIPVFEFFGATAGLDTKKIFVRDINQAFYFKGLPGIGEDLYDIVEYLRNEIDTHNVERIVCTGNSMGGYSAILFGHLLNVDEVHAFSPLSFIGRLKRFIYRDTRHPQSHIDAAKAPGVVKKLFDLKYVLTTENKAKTKYHIHYSPEHRLDNLHAVRIAKKANVKLHPHRGIGKHSKMIRSLRDSGELQKILVKSLETQQSRQGVRLRNAS
jgi:hypothetical protein